MKKFQKAKGGFQRKNDQDLLVLSQTVHLAMTDNDNFPNPMPDLQELEVAMEDFTGKLAIANRRGSPYDTATKNESREELEKVLAALAFYVNRTADGVFSILLSSGFKLSQAQKRVAIPTKVRGVELLDGRQNGQMVLRFEPEDTARLYMYRYTQDKDESGDLLWEGEEFITSSSRNNVIAPVIPGETYYVMVRAINTMGAGDWSDSVSWMAR